MADEILILDAAGSNVDGTDPGTALSIGPGTSYPLVEASFPAPPLSVLYSGSIDTEGESPTVRRHGNRTITLRLAMDEAGAVNTLLDALAAKFAKLQREGGTLKRTRKDGTVRIYDILAGDGWDPPYDFMYLLGNSAEVPVTFPAKPYARGTEQDLGDNVESTLPALVFTEASIPGDVSALGRLVIDNDDATNLQRTVLWGMQSKDYNAATSAALFYEAEGRTVLAGGATAAGSAPVSGAGSNVVRHLDLTPMFQAILSTQATGGGAHLSHVGGYRVLARVYPHVANLGVLSFALEWGVGDRLRFTRNATVTLDTLMGNTWRLVDLGFVNIPPVAAGTQRWEGRLLAASTEAGDNVDVDCLMLIPIDEGAGQASGVSSIAAAAGFDIRDEFNQAAGALSGKTLPAGGLWSGAGDTDDFAVETTGKTAQRVAVSDVDNQTGRYGLAGATTFTNVVAQVQWKHSALTNAVSGVLVRYTDTNNWVRAIVAAPGSSNTTYAVEKRVAGVLTTLGSVVGAQARGLNTYYTVQLAIDTGGRWYMYVAIGTYTPQLLLSGADSALATAGTLASGRVGIYDANTSALANTRSYDNFAAFAPSFDAAAYATQSLTISHNAAIREDSTGAIWQPVSRYEGNYLYVPPSGPEGRTARFIVKASRGDLTTMPDAGIDDISARLFVTPRYL